MALHIKTQEVLETRLPEMYQKTYESLCNVIGPCNAKAIVVSNIAVRTVKKKQKKKNSQIWFVVISL